MVHSAKNRVSERGQCAHIAHKHRLEYDSEDSAFSYDEIEQLMTALGTRDVAIPEPGTVGMLSADLLAIVVRVHARRRAR